MNLNNANDWSIYKYDLRIITHFSHDMLCKTMLMKICKCKFDSQNVLKIIETFKVKRKLFHFKLPSMNLEFANWSCTNKSKKTNITSNIVQNIQRTNEIKHTKTKKTKTKKRTYKQH